MSKAVAPTATDEQIALAYTSGRFFGLTAEDGETARDLALRLAQVSGQSVEVFHKRVTYVICQANHATDQMWRGQRGWWRLPHYGVTRR